MHDGALTVRSVPQPLPKNLPAHQISPASAASMTPTLSAPVSHWLRPPFLAAEEPDCGGNSMDSEASGIASRISATNSEFPLCVAFYRQQQLHMLTRPVLHASLSTCSALPSAFLQGPGGG